MKTDRIEYSILLIYYPRLLLNVKYSTERHSVYTKTDSFRKIILNTTIKHKQTIFISGCPKPKSLHIYPPPFFFLVMHLCPRVKILLCHQYRGSEFSNVYAGSNIYKKVLPGKGTNPAACFQSLITITGGITTAFKSRKMKMLSGCLLIRFWRNVRICCNNN